MNASNVQLLQLLQISPLHLHTQFSSLQQDTALPVQKPQLLPAEPTIKLSTDIAVEFAGLAADIQRALLWVNPALQWSWSAELAVSRRLGDEIQTPALAQLGQQQLKQQLWQLLCQTAAAS